MFAVVPVRGLAGERLLRPPVVSLAGLHACSPAAKEKEENMQLLFLFWNAETCC